MIQELLGGVMEERKMSINPGALFVAHGSSPAASSFSSSPSPSSVSSPSSSSEHQQNLRCPRCDSSNTKFCYYNNYNLTQPRHFCKTCRRYWTKGGALRNVPIGGGCRKAKPSPAASSGGRSGGGKSKPASPDCAARVSPGFGLDQEMSASPILWATPYSSHLLALLRASQFQNPNPNPNPPLTSSPNLNSLRIKEEAAMIGSTMVAEPTGVVLSDQSMSFDSLGQLAVGSSNSHWRSCGQFQYHQQQPPQPQPQPQPQQQHSMLFGEMQSSGIQELYHRLRSSGDYNNEQLPGVMNNVGSAAACSSSIMTAAMSTSTATSVLEPLPLTGGEFGYWNPVCSWADLPTTNGAFP